MAALRLDKDLNLPHIFSPFPKNDGIMNEYLGGCYGWRRKFQYGGGVRRRGFQRCKAGKAACADNGNIVQTAGQVDMDKQRNRAEAKAICNMAGNEKFDRNEILRAHREGTIKRMADEPVILAVQDTTVVNYNGQRKMEGNGYISSSTMGVNIRSCLAVTPDGLVLGALDQMGYNREEPKNESLTREQQKNRPIEEKESIRWLETMERVSGSIPSGTKVTRV
jgi:hypothetical protein